MICSRSAFLGSRLIVLTVAVGYAILQGGVAWADSIWPLLIVGFGAIVASFCIPSHAVNTDRGNLTERVAVGAAIILPLFVAFQLVPLPLSLLRMLDPARAEIAAALPSVIPHGNFAPISIAPGETWSHLLRVVGYALVFLLAREMARWAKILWLAVAPIVVIGVVEVGIAIIQSVSGARDVAGTYPDRNLFAGLAEMVLPFAFMYAVYGLHRRSKRHSSAFREPTSPDDSHAESDDNASESGKEDFPGFHHRRRKREPLTTASSLVSIAFLLACATGTFAAIVLSHSKLGFAATLASLLLIGVLGFAVRLRGWKTVATVVSMMVLAVLVFIGLPSEEQSSKLLVAASDPTAEGRLPIAKDTLHLIAAYPLFGSGLGTYEPALLRYQTSSLHVAWDRAHNDYLQVLSELGIIGSLIAAVLLGAVLVRVARAALFASRREKRLFAVACTASLTVLLIHCSGYFHMYNLQNAMAFAWIAGVSAGFPADEAATSRPAVAKRLRPFMLALACFLTIYAGAWLIYLNAFKDDLRAEYEFCRFGVCDTRGVRNNMQQLVGDAAGVEGFQELVRRDPAGPYRWCDLGASLEKAGRIAEARYCFSRAIMLGPHIPFMLFRAGRFYLDLNEKTEALELMSRVSENDPERAQSVFEEYEQRQLTVPEVMRAGLPPNPEVWRAYFNHWRGREQAVEAEQAKLEEDRLAAKVAAKKERDQAAEAEAPKVESQPPSETEAALAERRRFAAAQAAIIWREMAPRGYPDAPMAREYVGYMARKGMEAAAQAWQLYAAGQPDLHKDGYPESNAIFNGDFESEPSGVPFDWSRTHFYGVTIDYDEAGPYSGARSIRFQFNNTPSNTTGLGLMQVVPIKPGRYKFQAYVRTSKDFYSGEGVSFNIRDQRDAERLNVWTAPTQGSLEWKPVEQIFQVPEGTKLLQLAVARQKSMKFYNPMMGTLWIDKVSIRPVP